MVQIPQYEQQVGIAAPSRDVPGINTSVDNSIGEGLGRLGSAITSVADVIQRRNQQKAEFNAKVGYDTLQEKLQQGLVEAEKNAPADGSGIHDNFMLSFRSQEAGKFLDTITDPEIRNRYRTILDTADAEHWSNQSANTEWKLSNKYSVDQTDAMWNKRGQAIAADPASVAAYVDEMVAAIDKTPDLTAAQREEMKAKIRESGPKIAAEAVRTYDPEARFFMDGWGTHAQRLGFLSNRLVAAVQQAENAPGDPSAVSPAGAIGLMQVTVPAAIDAAKKLGDKAFLSLSPEQQIEFLKNPQNSMLYGSTYLGMMVDRYNGDVEAALVAYNAGMGNADKWLEAGRDYKALPKPGETQPYVQKIFDSLGAAKLVSGASEGGPTAHQDAGFWSSRYKGKRAIHTEMVPEFADRLQRAITAAEAATGQKAVINSLTRSNAEQREAYRNYLLTGGLAAVPAGMRRKDGTISQGSRHERGMAADIARGPVLDWLHQHAGEYGLEFLQGAAFAKDPVHIQMRLDGKGAPAPVRVADASGTGGLPVSDAMPDGVPGASTPARSGFISPIYADMSPGDLLKLQSESPGSYTKAAQAQLAQQTADQILSAAGATAEAAGDSRAAYSALDAIGDAEVRKDVATLIDSHFTRWTRIEKDQAEKATKNTWAEVNAALDANDTASAFAIVKKADVSPEDRAKMMERISKGAVQYDDPAALQTIDAARFAKPKAFMEANIRRFYGDQLTEATIVRLEEQQAKMKEDATKAATDQAKAMDDLLKSDKAADVARANQINGTNEKANGIIDKYFLETGIPTKADKMTPADAQHSNFVRSQVARELEIRQQASKTPLTITQIQDTVDAVMKTYPRHGADQTSYGWYDPRGWVQPDKDVNFQEVLKAYDSAGLDPDAMAAAIRKNGRQVNAQTMQQMLDTYNASKAPQ